jgi:hypothetical protein
MAVTTVDRRTLITDCDALTGITGPANLISSPRAEGSYCAGDEVQPAAGQTFYYFTPGTALDLDGHLLYVQSYTNAIQNGWKESTLSDSSHGMYLYDGTNELFLLEAGNDRDVFKHAGGGQVAFQSFLIDLDYLATKNTAGEIEEVSGTVAAFVETSVDRVGSVFHSESKALAGGSNCFIDIMRYDQTDTSGDSTTSNSGIFIYGGGVGTEGTFAEIVADDISIAADKGFGVIRQYSSGIYGCQGILKFGTTNTAGNAYFEDSNFTLIFEDRDVNDDKFKIFIFGNSTNTNSFVLTDGTIQSAGPGVELDWNSTWINVLTITNVNFIDLLRTIDLPTDTVTNSLSHSVEGCVFRNCGTITVGTVDFDDNRIIDSAATTNAVKLEYDVTAKNMIVSGYEGTADTSALVWNVNADPDGNLDGSSFIKGTAATHAIEFGTSVPASMTLRNCDFSGYNASDSQNDSTFYFADTGGSITLTLVSCTGNVTYKSAGATITIVSDPVTVQTTVKTADGVNVENARVFLKASDGAGPFPYQESVTSISNSGTLATVTHNSHGLATNDHVFIEGASLYQNNGVHQITYISANSYSYVMDSAPGSSPTGTITCTFVALYGLSNASGIVTTSRVYSADQNVEGWARKSSSSPYYKPGPLSGTVDSADGFSTTAVLVIDE